MAPLLSVRDLHVTLGGRRGLLRKTQNPVHAVAGVSLDMQSGEILGLAGESGCGKTTLARTILGLQREAAGAIMLNGATVSGLQPAQARQARRAVQYVHQDPGAALDPWWTIGRSLEEGLVIAGQAAGRAEQVDAALAAVGLDPSVRRRYPHELSGGQLRRIGLARILVLKPSLVILDEPTSGLDMSIQATVLTLLLSLRAQLGLSFLFISHDLGVMRRLCDRVAVMYAGRIVELAPTAELFACPLHPYARALLEAAPSLDPDTPMPPPMPPPIPEVPAHSSYEGSRGGGCVFAPRCRHVQGACRQSEPKLSNAVPGRKAACRRWHELALSMSA